MCVIFIYIQIFTPYVYERVFEATSYNIRQIRTYHLVNLVGFMINWRKILKSFSLMLLGTKFDE